MILIIHMYIYFSECIRIKEKAMPFLSNSILVMKSSEKIDNIEYSEKIDNIEYSDIYIFT